MKEEKNVEGKKIMKNHVNERPLCIFFVQILLKNNNLTKKSWPI